MRATVVHYEAAEAAALAERLRREGIDAAPYRHLGTKGFRELREDPPDAIVIDLMRMPSYGRAMGAMLREAKGTRPIPLVFLEGDPAKTARVKELLPDAEFAPLARLAAATKRAARRHPADPIVPLSKTSVIQKLRIRDGASVALVGAPEEFESTLAPLPPGRHAHGVGRSRRRAALREIEGWFGARSPSIRQAALRPHLVGAVAEARLRPRGKPDAAWDPRPVRPARPCRLQDLLDRPDVVCGSS